MKLWMIFLTLIVSSDAFALGPPLDPSNFLAPQLLVLDEVTLEIVKTVGIAADQRPYQPATPLGTKIGLDLGAELTLVHIPSSFTNALTQAGLNATVIPFFPVPRMQLHKGLGDVDIGGSFIGYRGYRLIGADIKYAIYQPEEGPIWALRVCYSNALISIVNTSTITPQILISRELDFAEPYLGIGYQFIRGTVTVPLPFITYQNSAYSAAFMSFVGTIFKVKPIGLKIALEGSYNSAGAPSLGTEIGFSF